jgi:hypothetical protein
MTGTTPLWQSPSPATWPTTPLREPGRRRQGNSPRYAIYDIVSPTPRPPGQTPSTHPPTPPTCSATARQAGLPGIARPYALVGSQLHLASKPLTGIHVILSNGGDDTERQQGSRSCRLVCRPVPIIGIRALPNGSRY